MSECVGLATGICVTHRMGDGFTLFTFIDAWATLCRMVIDKVHCPSFQLASFCPLRDISITNKIAIPSSVETNKIVMKRFVFNGASISNLKVRTNASVGGSTNPKTITNMSGNYNGALIKMAQTRHGHLRPSLMTLLQGREVLSVPVYSCGNFLGLEIMQFLPNEESKI